MSLSLSFLICEKGLIVVPTHGLLRIRKGECEWSAWYCVWHISSTQRMLSLRIINILTGVACYFLAAGYWDQQILLLYLFQFPGLTMWAKVQLRPLVCWFRTRHIWRHDLLLSNVISTFPLEYTISRRCLYLWKWLFQSPLKTLLNCSHETPFPIKSSIKQQPINGKLG